MDLIDLIDSRRFLGSEFLMWLWFKSECYDGLLEIGADEGRLEVVFDDALTLEAHLAETERNTFKGGAPAYSPEAKTALRQGKRVARAKVRVIRDGREWVFTLKAESLDLSSIKIPAVLSREEDDKFYERMYFVEEIEDIIAALYREFTVLRLSADWSKVILPAMQAWITTDEHATPEMYPITGSSPSSTRRQNQKSSEAVPV
ncbi:MAG: hypothetical protein ACNA8W_14300 [Bradymonadaceae bacterium]